MLVDLWMLSDLDYVLNLLCLGFFIVEVAVFSLELYCVG